MNAEQVAMQTPPVETAPMTTPVPVEAAANAPVTMPVEGMTTEPTMPQSWFESAQKFLEGYLPAWASELLVFGLAFFLLGFLLKSFGRILVFTIIAGIIVVAILHYAHVISLDMELIRHWLGIGKTTLQEAPGAFVSWARGHIIAVISAIVGFLVGWKLG